MIVSDAYDCLECIIMQGFLTVGISMSDVYIVLKNITDKENSKISLYVDETKDRNNLLFKLCLSTYSVNGESILHNREDKLNSLFKLYDSIPPIFLNKLVDTLRILNEIFIESIEFLEGFCYSERSRYLWKVWKGSQNKMWWGTPGIDSIGLNSVQENWIMINQQLDAEDEYSKDFSLAILISSSFNAKGAKVVSTNYDTSRKELIELRDEIAKYGYDRKRVEEQKKESDWTAPVKSREDLVRELYRQMRGEKDRHDLFIDQWMKKQQDRADAAKKAVEEKQTQFKQQFETIDLTLLEDSKPVTLEDIKKIEESMPKKGTAKFISAYEDMDHNDRFIKKLSARIVKK